MEPTQALADDHARLRRKLALLDAALEQLPATRPLLRDIAGSLQRLLTEHLKREQPIIQHIMAREPDAATLPVRDHTYEQTLLHSINMLSVCGARTSLPLLVLRLSQIIEQLRTTMETQERFLFPLLRTAVISRWMSINEIIRYFPGSETVFEQLQVNRLREGYESLDELAWRRGLDAAVLVERIRQSAASAP